MVTKDDDLYIMSIYKTVILNRIKKQIDKKKQMRFVQKEKTLIEFLKIDENRELWGCHSDCFKKNKKICSKCSNQLDSFKITVTGSELSYEPKQELQDNWEVRKSLQGRISVISEITRCSEWHCNSSNSLSKKS